jgi:hypothetical protein
MRITVLDDAATPAFPGEIIQWLSYDPPQVKLEANNVKEP